MSSHFKECLLSPENANSLYFRKEPKGYGLLHEMELTSDTAPVAKEPEHISHRRKGKPSTPSYSTKGM